MGERWVLLNFLVNIPARANTDNQNKQPPFLNIIDNTVIPCPKSIASLFGALDFFAAWRERGSAELVYLDPKGFADIGGG